MEVVSAAKELMEAVTEPQCSHGSLEMKSTEWLTKNNAARFYICVAIDETILEHLVNCRNAHEMWTTLINLYGHEADPEKFMLPLLSPAAQARVFDIVARMCKARGCSPLEEKLFELKELFTVFVVLVMISKNLPTAYQAKCGHGQLEQHLKVFDDIQAETARFISAWCNNRTWGDAECFRACEKHFEEFGDESCNELESFQIQ